MGGYAVAVSGVLTVDYAQIYAPLTSQAAADAFGKYCPSAAYYITHKQYFKQIDLLLAWFRIGILYNIFSR